MTSHPRHELAHRDAVLLGQGPKLLRSLGGKPELHLNRVPLPFRDAHARLVAYTMGFTSSARLVPKAPRPFFVARMMGASTPSMRILRRRIISTSESSAMQGIPAAGQGESIQNVFAMKDTMTMVGTHVKPTQAPSKGSP